MSRDPEDAMNWLLVVGLALLAAIVLARLALALAGALQTSADKRECRRAGSRVLETDGAEWHCARVTPERP